MLNYYINYKTTVLKSKSIVNAFLIVVQKYFVLTKIYCVYVYIFLVKEVHLSMLPCS